MQLVGKVMIAWSDAGQFSVLADILSDQRLDWPALILSLMNDAHAHDQVLGLALSTLATFLSCATVNLHALHDVWNQRALTSAASGVSVSNVICQMPFVTCKLSNVICNVI